jgi:Zinc dependent phospholipase C
VPLLLLRYPGTTPEALTEAHAYAYGGCILQDIGYYPFGNHFFSDLLHYVRTGDFVENMIKDSTDVNEFAFALGALAHYTSDTYGHPAVNQATAAEYPKLRNKFGRVVTYGQDPTAHLQTEFGFDVVEVVHNRYAPEAYKGFIGFQVSKPLLERAFRDTYGFEVKQVLTHEDLAIGTYRKTVSTLLPKMTKVAAVKFGSQVEKDNPGFDSRKMRYRMSRAEYEKSWGNTYQKPGVGSRIFAFFIGILPKIGPLKALKLRLPDADSQQSFLHSMNDTVDHYNAFLTDLRQQVASHSDLDLRLPDRDLDTGLLTAQGEYKLADYAHSKLLAEIAKHPETPIPISLRDRMTEFYHAGAKNYVAQKPQVWQETQQNLQRLQNAKLDDPQASDRPTVTEQPDIHMAK